MNSLAVVRGLLQSRALLASGFPAGDQVKYEGKLFSPTKGTPWARMTFLPSAKRPFSVAGSSRLDDGLFQVDLYFPPLRGTKTLEDAVDAVLAEFTPGQSLSTSSVKVWINYAERGPVTESEESVDAFVRVSWRSYSND
jgi:hypothetical protein